jgi:hypothetical protein
MAIGMTLLLKSEAAPASPPKRSRRKWFPRLLLGLILILGIVAYLLPQLAAQLCRSREGLAWISGSPPGRVEVGGASLGWQSPVLLSEVKVNDSQGRSVAQVAAVTSKRSLWDLLIGPRQPLQLTLEGLHLQVQLEEPRPPQGRFKISILTENLQKLKLPAAGQPMSLQFTNAAVTFLDSQREVVDEWRGLQGSYSCGGAPKPEQNLSLEMPADSSHHTGALRLKVSSEYAAAGTESVTLDVQGEQVSLRAVQPWLEKYLGPQHGLQQCSGTLRGKFERDSQTGWALKVSSNLRSETPLDSVHKVAYAEEPSGAQLQLESSYSREADTLTIPHLELAAEGAALRVQGSVAQVSGEENVDITAHVQTPGASLVELLPPALREEIQAEGVSLSDVKVKGPLLPIPGRANSPLEISMQVSWQKAAAYGLEAEPGQLRLALVGKELRAESVNVRINGGTLRQLPRVDLATDPPTLRFEPGVMLENIALTEEVCRGWMKYVSPTLANATSAEGRFSLAMQAGTYQLEHPQQAELSGVLTVHEGRVGPGPLAIAMLQNANQLEGIILRNPAQGLSQRAVLLIHDEAVGFRLHQGRVEHDEFGAFIGDVRVATSGSVGLDQTLQLLVTMPIPDKWTQNAGPILQALRGEQIQFAVTGTLNEPEVDASPLREFGKRVGIKAGAGLLEKILERRLQRGR